MKPLNPEMRAKVVAMLSDPKNTKGRLLISKECGVHISSVKAIANQLKIKVPESASEQTSTIKIIDSVHVEEFMNVCLDPRFDDHVISTNFNPAFKLEEVSEEILKKHRVRDFTSAEAERLKQLHTRESKDYHGVFCFPAAQEDLEPLRNFQREVLERQENKAEFTPIFQVAQATVHDQLLAALRSPMQASSLSSPASADSHVPAAAPMPTEDVAVDNMKSLSKKRKRTSAMKNEERGGDQKRKHIIMDEWQALVLERIEEGEKKLKDLQVEISPRELNIKHFDQQIALLKQSPDSSRSTRRLPAAKSSDHDSRLQHLEDRLNQAKEELAKIKLDLRNSNAELEQKRRSLELTREVIQMSAKNYKRIIQTSPYHKIVEGTLNDKKLLSIILAERYNKSQGAHADSKFKGGSILQAIGRKQYLIVLLNGYKAMCILRRILRHRDELLEMIRTKLCGSLSPEWMQENFDETRIWNFLCSRQFEVEQVGPIRPVLWPVEEGAFLLVDNLTPHAGAPNDGPDAFRLHWYAYLRAVDARVDDMEGDQIITIDLLKEYKSLCEHAQRSAVGRGEPPVFWSPA